MRDYDYMPRPLTESHYHIRELIEAQERRARDRTEIRDRKKSSAERDDDILRASAKELKMFFCVPCNDDFAAEAIKQVETDWSNPSQRIAFYRAKCFCGAWSIRLITDVHRDAYWFKSRRVHRDRGSHFADTLQPHETGFNIMYKKI